MNTCTYKCYFGIERETERAYLLSTSDGKTTFWAPKTACTKVRSIEQSKGYYQLCVVEIMGWVLDKYNVR